jgi:nicotinamide-nucleotide amidase
MRAYIITIGDEILIGQTIDTNAAWLGAQFNKRGVQVTKILSIKDEEAAIHMALDEAFVFADVILMTGGLGPTLDDITKQSLCTYFNVGMRLSESSLNSVEKFVKSRGYFLNENNRQQAMVPENATIIPNHMGTAPIMQFEKNGKYLFSMPGVPFEMKDAMEKSVFPFIESKFALKPVKHHTVMTFGMPEAFLAEQLESWANELPEFIHLAYLPSPKGIKIRLSVYDTNIPEWEDRLEVNIEKLRKLIPELIFSETDQNLETILFQSLKKHQLHLATAESCTGGLISQLITSNPGSSEVFKGSVVAYSNEIKSKILGVSENVLESEGAVSEEVVRSMAENIRFLFHVDCSIAVSGIAGPGGGSDNKPVGTTWIAVSVNGKTESRKFQFGSRRDINTERAAYSGMYMLFDLIKRTYEQ